MFAAVKSGDVRPGDEPAPQKAASKVASIWLQSLKLAARHNVRGRYIDRLINVLTRSPDTNMHAPQFRHFQSLVCGAYQPIHISAT